MTWQASIELRVVEALEVDHAVGLELLEEAVLECYLRDALGEVLSQLQLHSLLVE